MLPVVSITSAMSSCWCAARAAENSSCDAACSASVNGTAPARLFCNRSERYCVKRTKLRLSSHAPAVSVPDWIVPSPPPGLELEDDAPSAGVAADPAAPTIAIPDPKLGSALSENELD